MNPAPRPYWLTKEWWTQGDPPNSELGNSELARGYPEVGESAWKNRRRRAMQMCAKECWGIDFLPLHRGYHDQRAAATMTAAPERMEQSADGEPILTPERVVEPPKHKDTHVIKPDGSQESDKLLEMSLEESKDPEYLLTAHGFDLSTWELVSARNNMWHGYSKQDGRTLLFASRITVRPRCDHLDFAALMAAVRGIEPLHVTPAPVGSRLLECGFVDMHLGNSTIDTYRETLARVVRLLDSGPWAEVIIPVGSDLFHCDNFKNTTSNGTVVSSVDWPKAWADAYTFFSTIIEYALPRAARVKVYYIIGNHDESMSWAFCNMLEARYPTVEFDTGIEERKVHRFEGCAIGLTHGDNRTRRDLDRIFTAEFPEFAEASLREVHAAHYHHEVTVDQFGVVTRSLSTKARTDKWHREEGYVGARKRFMLFEYADDELTDIHYV